MKTVKVGDHLWTYGHYPSDPKPELYEVIVRRKELDTSGTPYWVVGVIKKWGSSAFRYTCDLYTEEEAIVRRLQGGSWCD